MPSIRANWLYPPVCLICGQAGRPGLDCCAGCEMDLKRAQDGCRRCGLVLPRPVVLCGRCVRRPPPFDAVHAAFGYTTPVDGLIHAFKFRRNLAAGRLLAGLLARALAARGVPRPQALVPVPLHPWRQMRRGFNQAELLCRDLSRYCGGLPVAPLLRRRRHTSAQSDLPAARRRGNLRRAFTCRPPPPGLTHVALVDDVMTTGSTVAECARTLRRAGVASIDVWVVARA